MSVGLRQSAVDGAQGLLEQIAETMRAQPPRSTLSGRPVTDEYLISIILTLMFEGPEFEKDPSKRGKTFREMYVESLPRLTEIVLEGLKKYFISRKKYFESRNISF